MKENRRRATEKKGRRGTRGGKDTCVRWDTTTRTRIKREGKGEGRCGPSSIEAPARSGMENRRLYEQGE